MLLGFAALAIGKTDEIIIISVFGAITLYILSMISLFRLRKNEPKLARPFKVPFYPLTPMIALGLALLCLGALIYYNFVLSLVYAGLMALGYGYYFMAVPKTARAEAAAEGISG
jgi:ethanolamine permease